VNFHLSLVFHDGVDNYDDGDNDNDRLIITIMIQLIINELDNNYKGQLLPSTDMMQEENIIMYKLY
jgi:hypothetical protein